MTRDSEPRFDAAPRRLRTCYGIAASAPLIAATASFAILRTAWAIGGPRMMTTATGRSFWRIYEWGIFPGNIVVGSVAALAIIVLLHPNHHQRWQIGLLALVGSPLVFLLCYVVWERVWQALF